MERVQYCFICNVTVGTSTRHCVHVFDDDTTFQTDKKLPEIIEEIIGKSLEASSLISQVICKKCLRTLVEYDGITKRLEVLKKEVQENMSKTAQIQASKKNVVTIKKHPKQIVLSKSKLQPLPANFVLNMKNVPTLTKTQLVNNDSDSATAVPQNVFKMTEPTISLKATIGSTVFTHTLKSTMKMEPDPLSITPSDMNLIMTPSKASVNKKTAVKSSQNSVAKSTKNPILSFNVDALPKEFFSTTERETSLRNEQVDLDDDSDDNDSTENNDEQEMEIDEDCSLAVVPVTTDDSGKLIFDVDGKQSKTNNLFDMGLLLSSDSQEQNNDAQSKYILDKLQILADDDDDGDEQTIVMKNSDGTTIIKMGAGQKVVYDGENFSFVPCGQTTENNDSQDSNEESQIELQVSGDEETANAIIAAAQEQGGAFIKVESGEMYKVKSVQSKNDDEEALHIQSIVECENGQYTCQLCKQQDSTKDPFVGESDKMMLHLKKVHNARVYICQICGLVLRKRTEYTNHIEEHAEKSRSTINKSKLHACNLCSRKFTSRALLAAHHNSHSGARPHSCRRCHKAFASKYTLQAHEKTHLERPRPHKCPSCGKAFLTLQNLAQHEKTHSSVKEFVCKVCEKAFSTQHNLEVHGVIHSGRKPFFCSVCSKAFARKPEVKDHMRTHTGERPFACDICGATFSQRSNLLSHKRATHLDDKRYHCQLCPKKFKRRRLLDYHTKAAHTGERPLNCSVCRATFVYPEHYKKHLKIHNGEKPYACEVCGKTFTSRDNRNTHRFVHSDKKPYECLSCGAGYMRKQLLYAHMHTTGHVAESIVVNQPRVIKATENIFETTQELEMNQTDADANTVETTMSLVQASNEATFYTIENLEGLIENSSEDQREILTTDAKGDIMRLIQVQLPDGKTGWVAIDQ
ncbi:zinc finger protein 543-like isoform X2 [Ostrinia nubilalis]|uniref:zinc finger protein 543-like isoform X2 n=1 Tax=Ostrinia nubilalis TaxID=29057 RepID=UPI00308254DE